MGQSAMATNVSLPGALDGGEATSGSAASNDWGAIGGFSMICATLCAAAIQQSSRSISSGLLIAVASSSHSRLRVIIAKFRVMKN